MIDRPTITSAPGLAWRKRSRDRWEARWQCRTDLGSRGYRPRAVRLYVFDKEPTETQIGFVQERCAYFQGEMLAWSKGGLPTVASFNGTLRGLVDMYRCSPDSNYSEKRFKTRKFYDNLCQSLLKLTWHDENGNECKAAETRLSEIRAKLIKRWHRQYVDRGTLAMGHQVMSMLRILFGYGMTDLEDPDCERLSVLMSKLEFPLSKPRGEILTYEMATEINERAHACGKHSIAMAQAFQSDVMLRQKDVIGEWVPLNEKRVPLTDITHGNKKWIRGLRWEEIDANLILRHTTSKRLKDITIDLTLAPMVMKEFELLTGGVVTRDRLPANGPIVVAEHSGRPWETVPFRNGWRQVADDIGLPRTIRNMDSRAGAITEATRSGAPLEAIKHAATHSDISMTQRYARGAEEKTKEVMQARIQYREQSTKKR